MKKLKIIVVDDDQDFAESLTMLLEGSGYSIDGPAQAILDAGALEFIQKPFTLDKLSEKLKAV